MKEIYLVRHGEIASNKLKRYAGWSSEGLTQLGVIQAREVAKKLNGSPIKAIFSSPLTRAVQTAQIIGTKLNLPLEIEHGLIELNMGPWEGKLEAEVALQYPKEWMLWNTRPADLKLKGRESLDELLARVLQTIDRIEGALNENEAAIAVTHVALIRVLLLYLQNKNLNLYKSVQVANGYVFNFQFRSNLHRTPNKGTYARTRNFRVKGIVSVDL